MKACAWLRAAGVFCLALALGSCSSAPSTGGDSRDVIVGEDARPTEAGLADGTVADVFSATDARSVADASAEGWTPGSCGSIASGPLFVSLPAPSPAPRNVSTAVGGPEGHVGGTAAEARFSQPWGLATDADGQLFVSECRSHTIRRVDVATWEVATLAGGAGERGAADGIGTLARFSCPQSLVVLEGVLYVADSANHTVRRVDLVSGEVRTVAGDATEAGWADGVGSASRLSRPSGMATDGVYVYLADTGNHVIRRFDPATRRVITLAGAVGIPGWRDGGCAEARFNNPRGLATDGPTLYISEAGNSTIRTLDIATGAVATLAGTPVAGFSFADGVGADAHFHFPDGLAADGTNLFVSDANNNVVRQVTIATGEVTTIAGKPEVAGAIEGLGDAARFEIPAGIALLDRKLVVVDVRNHRIRLLTTPD